MAAMQQSGEMRVSTAAEEAQHCAGQRREENDATSGQHAGGGSF